MKVMSVACLGLFALALSTSYVSASRPSKQRSHVEEMIASLREKTRASQEEEEEEVVEAAEAHSVRGQGSERHPRPFTEKNAGEPCRMRGLVVRREMGDLGVTSFQVKTTLRIDHCVDDDDDDDGNKTFEFHL